MPGFVGRLCEKHATWADDGTGFDEEPGGWHSLIEVLFDAIGAEMARAPGARMEFLEVRQSLGSLHCRYRLAKRPGATGPPLDGIEGLIAVAEAISSMTCDACGSPGSLRREGSGRLSTRCEAHAVDGSEPVDDGRPKAVH